MSSLLALHGAIHVLGFLRWSRLVAVPQLSGRTLFALPAAAAWPFALVWLTACLLLIGSAIELAAARDGWWKAALAGVVLSQALIVVAWSDAKAGTLANLILVLPIAAAAAHTRFERSVAAEVRALLASSPAAPSPIVSPADLAPLPEPVRGWLERSGVVGRPRASTVRLQQKGELRTAPDAAWMPARAEQYFTLDEPGFIWRVDARMFGFLPVAGRDRYASGRGQMLIKAASLVNVVNAGDDKIAHGALLRFLAEMMWFPSAALSPYLTWEAVTADSAKVTVRDGGLRASALFRFDGRRRVVGIHAQRYLGGGADAKLTPWSGSCTAWRVIRGVEVPVRGDVSWTLPSGDFSYYRWEILDVEYDRAELYGSAPAAAARDDARPSVRPAHARAGSAGP